MVHSVDAWCYAPGQAGLYGVDAVLDPEKRVEVEAPIENEVVCPGSSPLAGGSIHCSVGPAIGRPSATRARNIAT